MKLKEYFTLHCVNVNKWSKKHQINRMSIQHILRGMVPTLNMGVRIYKATNREVTLKDMGVEI